MVDWEAFYNSFRQPDFIPGYEIQNRLGGGAFGDVYKARKRSIGKAYAIKFLKLDEGQQSVVERELEQVRLFAAIDHPNLVTVEDMGVVQGVPYLVMGYAGEDTLARRIKRKELDREFALRYFVQACRGVLALHDRRLAHFDLKPSNIFLKGDVARVGDYGLAKLVADGRQTLSFGRGTPHYMAPEMFKNRADQRADLYSLGVILFECIAGKLPFCDESSGGGLGLVLREDDLPPEFPADFPPQLRQVVERALRIDPALRYQSVLELLEELGQSARQGDSIRIPWGPDAAPGAAVGAGTAAGLAPAPTPTPAPTATPTPTPVSTAGVGRSAAQEFVRGAASVARGVWDGVLESARGDPGLANRPSSADETLQTGAGAARPVALATPAPQAPLVRARGELASDIVSISTLDEEGYRSTTHDPAHTQELVLRTSASPALLSAPSVPAPVLNLPVHMGATIPVPPRVDGGLARTVQSIAMLGFEVMVALISGPIAGSARKLARVFERVLRGAHSGLSRTLRFLLFLLLMALLGALIPLSIFWFAA